MGKPEARLIAALRRRRRVWLTRAESHARAGRDNAELWTNGFVDGLGEAIEIVQKRAAREARRGKVGR